MDFNPLDLLAAAALSDKESPSKSKGSKCNGTGSELNNSEEAENKDADDDSDNNMGKSKSSSLNQPVKINDVKPVCEMSPQKISWSPDSFLSCLDKPIEHEKLIIEQLNAEFVKDKLHRCVTDESGTEEKEVNVEKDINEPLEGCNKASKGNDVDLNSSFISDQDLKPCLDNSQLQNDTSESIKQEIKDEPFSPKAIASDGLDSKHVKDEDLLESGGQSDTDTAETSDEKPLSDDLPEINTQEIVSLDHPYCLIPGKLRIPAIDTTDDDIDVCSDSSPLTEDAEQRSRNFSLDCNYLKSGILEGKAVIAPQLNPSNLSSPQKLGSCDESSIKVANTDQSAFKHVGIVSPERPGPSYGKFRIGTFASFSSSNLELEKYLRGFDASPDKKFDSGLNHSNKLPQFTSSVQPLLQSPTPDWEISEAGSETHDDSSDARTPYRLSPDFITDSVTEWSHPMYHDHDYCAKTLESDNIPKLPIAKRKYTKRKNKLDSAQHEKIMKAKYLKKELLKDSYPKTTPSQLPDPALSLSEATLKANPVGRPRKRQLERPLDEEIDPETGAKMKITGQFQDQYVYYLSKSRTTSRRRQTPTLPLLTDKIIVPAPKPGDIVVPHLTDADIEIIRTKGRHALNLPGRPHIPHNVTHLPVKSTIPSSLPVNHTNEFMSDEHIVSTILSMENDNLASPSSSQSHDFSQNSDLCNGQASMNTVTNITPEEQVLNYLLSVDDHTSSGLFPTLPSDPHYSKIDHLSDTDFSNHNSLQNHSDILSSPSALASHFEKSVLKSDTEGSNCLPDDLTFISHSQLTNSSSTSQEFISHSPVKSELSSDLAPLGTPPSLAPSALKLTSIEKTLDYLGIKDGEIKLEADELSNSNITHSDLLPPLEPSNPVIGDDDTPWIVTVTLYFNDVPAIIILNEPYIRLVDIHKQILPAKDTGILKKRCQLLNIPVLNCTEMHRYFLVQYGKAYNSKSTLIISKIQATELVGYYATPQPRLGRSEEPNNGRRRSDGSSLSPVTVTQDATPSVQSKKRGCNKTKKILTPSGLPSPDVNVTDIKLTEDGPPVQAVNGLNKRTRHKKINYLEMLRGQEKEKEKPNSDPIIQTIESVLASSTDQSIHPSKVANEKCPSLNKSRPKKNNERKRNGTEKKKSDKRSDRRKSVDNSDKKGKSSKLTKSSKVKGSHTKIGKKDKLSINKEGEFDKSLLFGAEESLNKSSKNKSLKLKVNSLLNFASSSHRKLSSSPPSLSSNLSKKGLFSCGSNLTPSTPIDPPSRVLAVAHQAAYSKEEGESRLPSQPADIHLDLFTKSSSACVRCHTCSQFLSVPHFMKHHHVPMDNEWLATEAAHRILVPRNKENISDYERKLWEEFHKLQEAIGGFGEADSDSDAESEACDTDYELHDDPSSLETSGASYLSMDNPRDTLDVSYDNSHTFHRTPITSSKINCDVKFSLSKNDRVVNISSHQTCAADRTVNNGESCVVNNQHDSVVSPDSNSNSLNHSQICTSSVRTSSRRRKSKQLFSIENYCTSPTKKLADDEGHCSLSGGM